MKNVLIFAFCAVTAVYIRLYPLWGHIWSPTNEQATMSVILNLKKNLLDQVHAQQPNMPLAQADRLASEKLNETLRKDNTNVRRAIERMNDIMHAQMKAAPDPLYLLESDPYYYYGLTQNIVDKGRMAESIKGNRYFDPLMTAPFGFWQPLTLHPYVGYLIYKAACLFDPQVPLMSAVAYTPLLITLFALAAFIWCGRLFGLSPPAILAGCFYLSMAPIFLKRSSLGWYDTDPYHVLFPFLFLGIFFKSLEGKKHISVYALGLGLLLLFYSLLWQGWVFLFFMTFICSGAAAGYAWIVLKDMAAVRRQVVFAASYLAVTVIGGSLLYGFVEFLSFFTDGAKEMVKFTVKGMNVWPNLFIEVGELKSSTLRELFANAGSLVLLGGVVAGIVRAVKDLLLKPRQAFSVRIILVGVFCVITMVMTLKAERFALFTLIPLSLLFAWGVEWGLSAIRPLPFSKIGVSLAVGVLLLVGWNDANKNIRTVLTPIFNTAWDDALTSVRDLTPSDSIVNTWWPPGHFIKGIAQRRVPFDGASLSEGPVGYWMANVFLSTDENKARGMVRMLNLSGNRATEFLTAHGLTTAQAVAMLHLITAQTPAEARATLKPFLSPDDLTHLLLLTHGGSPHSYVLVYNELVDANIGLAFVGHRDFKKIEAINADPRLAAAVPSPNSKEFIDFLWSVSGGPTRYSGPLALVDTSSDTLTFNEGVSVHKGMDMALVNSPQYGRGIPASIVFARNGQVIEKELPNAGLNYSVLVYEEDGVPVCRLMDRELANSLIMRLYFFDGAGLTHFKPLKSSRDLTGRTHIKVFEVLWN